MGLRQAWWTFIPRWVTLGQNEVRQARPTDRKLPAIQYRYLDAVRALRGTTGQRISCPRIRRPLADCLFDSKSSEEEFELQATRLQVATCRLSYANLTRRTNTRGNTRRHATPPAQVECTRGNNILLGASHDTTAVHPRLETPVYSRGRYEQRIFWCRLPCAQPLAGV